MKKYAITISMTTLSEKEAEDVISTLYKLLQEKFEKTEVTQHSLYAWQNTFTGKPLEFTENGDIKVEKFDISNIPTDVL